MAAFSKILVAYDSSPHSRRALEKAVEVAGCSQAQLGLVYAYDPVPAYLGEPYYEDAVSRAVLNGRELLKEVVTWLAEKGLTASLNIIQGPPAEAILKVAETEGYDLIVMGSRGLNAWQGLLLGSTSQRVLQHGQIPVLIVR